MFSEVNRDYVDKLAKMELAGLIQKMEEMAGQPRNEDPTIRRPGEMNSYEKHNREKAYAAEVIKQFIPKDKNGNEVKYTKIL